MSHFPSHKCWPHVWTTGQDPRQILLTNTFVNEWAWRRRPAFLRMSEHRQDVLFAGPWVGEFGWELMNWQAYLRTLRPQYRKIIVSSRDSSRALYEDICDEFIPHEITGRSNSHVAFDLKNPDELIRILSLIPSGAHHLAPQRYIPASAQHFIRFGRPAPEKYPVDILIHARGRAHETGRNWPLEKWVQLVHALREAGWRIGSVGISSSTMAVPHVIDYRDIPLKETVDVMASARLMLGPSSGPLHLASLCGVPHLVWTDKRTYGMGKTSREKYESWWNPMKTMVQVVDDHDFDPPVDLVLQSVLTMLKPGASR